MTTDAGQLSDEHALILFDGVCNLCNASVQFIIRRDPRAYFQFASLQSPLGQRVLRESGWPGEALSSIILIEDGHYYDESTAALRIASRLTGAWRLLSVFRIIPRPLRDAAYRLVAKHRYRWFGRRDSCMLPTGELSARFRENH